jgi:hypothetical protein
MTHKMILMSHDFKEVKAILIARRKDNAGVAQVAEHDIRNVEGESSNDSTSPRSEAEG